MSTVSLAVVSSLGDRCFVARHDEKVSDQLYAHSLLDE